MKVRIGISLGPASAPGQFAEAVDQLEQAGVDSLWLSELVYTPLVEPFTGMAFALSRTRHLKVGTGVAVRPRRSPPSRTRRPRPDGTWTTTTSGSACRWPWTASPARWRPRSGAAGPRPTRRHWSPGAGTAPAASSASTSRPG